MKEPVNLGENICGKCCQGLCFCSERNSDGTWNRIIINDTQPKGEEKCEECTISCPSCITEKVHNCIFESKSEWHSTEREAISKILVTWGMPTRQVAINEILERIALARKEAEILGYVKYKEHFNKKVSKEIENLAFKAGQQAMVEEIKALIINETAIPKGARNPTRDSTVILGEKLVNKIVDMVDKSSLEESLS